MINSAGPKRSSRTPRLLMALVLGGVAAAGVFLYVNSVQQQAEQAQIDAANKVVKRAPALVAKVNVPARTPLNGDYFEVRQLPAEAVIASALTDPAEVGNRVLDTALAAGEQVLSNHLIDPNTPDIKRFADLIPPGKRAMSVQFSDIVGSAGLIVPGDFVDVLAVFSKDTLGKDQSMILLQDIQVLAVAQSTSVDQLAKQGTDTPQAAAPPPSLPRPGQPAAPVPSPTPQRLPVTTGARILTLAVAPEAAERLALAESHGNLRYIARPVGERDQSAVLPADLATLNSPIAAASAQIIATEISPTNVKVGDTVNIKITVKNISDKPLQTQGPQPNFTYVQGQTYFTQQFASEPGKWRVAIGSAGLDATELPYRWGLGGDLAPGASTTVNGSIKVTQDFQPTNFWAAVVAEPANVVQTGVGITLITSLPESVAVVAVDAANVRSSPSIASSVIDQVKYGTELQIIGQSADWFKIQLPDKREGWVAAGWIVTAGR
jgi:Flp pilus assembly protein CpaB